MKNILLIPDSFKGTMSSEQICSIMNRAIKRHYPDTKVTSIPVADGGEGSVDAFLQALGGEKRNLTVQGPFGELMESFYGIIKDDTAVIEMASCAGLPLVGDELRPDKTTTYGVGQLMLDAAKNGCKHIIVGLGGSATNDGGCGVAAACGVVFKDKDDNAFVPTGGTMGRVASIDTSELDPALKQVTITTMCDIDNPFYGTNGAAYIFGPQKGADPEMVKVLDANLKSLAGVIQKDLDIDVQAIPGSGAAGGMGGGMAAFFSSTLQMGIETVLETVNFDSLLKDADLVLTGEGKIDGQSLRGKVVIGVSRRAKKAKVPVLAIVGDIGDDVDGAYDEGVTGIFSINRVAVEFKKAKGRAPEDMDKTIDNLMRFTKQMGL
ncbi:MAG: glycerate 2-kinase [Sphaerochaeta sp.]|jgi:glycerate kinase|uniref:Glycerate kinase n=1 Tax=Sphaerochaeta halotolerans TaxID=2293840 RepID=A0A372MJ88_9SPIR|nr:glycerate kinase [Sphaerochaeta halotolerans]MDK2860323.1 glycerate 2-kinase [Sphaerochaeta sp.]RFU95867.1 glycerate kinase [Sphaerochaeta halotolerans]